MGSFWGLGCGPYATSVAPLLKKSFLKDVFSEMLPFDLCKELFWVLPCIEFMEERVRVRVATRSEADSVPKLWRKAHSDCVLRRVAKAF